MIPAICNGRPAALSHFDCRMNALVGRDPAEEDQVASGPALERMQRQIDPVVDGAKVVQARLSIRIANGHVVAIPILLVDGRMRGDEMPWIVVRTDVETSRVKASGTKS